MSSTVRYGRSPPLSIAPAVYTLHYHAFRGSQKFQQSSAITPRLSSRSGEILEHAEALHSSLGR